MRGIGDGTLLDLWESGQDRHPIDRSLLLCAWARPELAHEQLARLPLGAITAALLHVRAALFGARIEFTLACMHCGESLAMPLTTDQLLADVAPLDPDAVVELHGYRFRLPDSRDLAAVAHEGDVRQAALLLLERCCLQRPGGTDALHDVLAEAEARLDAADPLADLRLDVACHACGRHTDAAIDAGALVWGDLQRHARHLLEQVHLLARSYGWTEHEVLALGPARRAAYLDLATG